MLRLLCSENLWPLTTVSSQNTTVLSQNATVLSQNTTVLSQNVTVLESVRVIEDICVLLEDLVVTLYSNLELFGQNNLKGPARTSRAYLFIKTHTK